ncbi:hypothetical protein I601_2228 [Nocardioides dokdonensis FR1436]|uniref:Uncharacterized protein n=1 Tax=Nocardioides dokdonensis FR1436 TaxID=1300347 RepID=A0A1A9GM26_9ACTN|nr:hypothetical protein [Nocardioides dokdonensis]ANH38653.1 hypothetical protein I601_2228 [Nocardioides dokdonensis FR1436]
MKPLLTVVIGLLLTVGDLRIGDGELAPDLLPDPVGWVLVAVALGRLAHLHQGFRLGAVAAWVGAAISVPLWPGLAGLGEVEPLLGLATGIVDLVVVAGVLSGVVAVVPTRSDGARSLRTAYVVVAVVFTLLAVGAEVSVAFAVLALTAGLVNLVVLVIVLVFLGRVARDPEAVPSGG